MAQVSEWVPLEEHDTWLPVETAAKISPSLLASRQAVSKSEFEANRPESTIGSRAREAAIGALEPFTVESVANTAKAAGSALWDALRGRGTAKAQELVKGLITTPIRPIQSFVEGAQTGDYDKAAYGAGGILSQTVPTVAGVGDAAPRIARAALPAEEALMSGAATARAAVAKMQPSIPLSTSDVAVQAAKALVRPVVNTGAATAEALARWKAGKPTNLASAGILDSERPRTGEIERGISQADNGISPSTGEAWEPGPAYRAAPEPIAALRPGAPAFIQQQLERLRQNETPEQLYAREQQIRNQEIPPEPSGPYAVPPLQRPVSPRPGLWDEIMGTQSPKDLPPDAPAINKWMGIRPEEVIRGANPGQRIIDEGLLGGTKEATKANIDTALESAAQDMQAKLKASTDSGVKIDAQTPVYDAWAKVEKRIGRPQDSSFQAQIQGVVDDIEAKYPDLAKLTPEQTHALKVDLGDSINWKGTGFDEPVNQMMVQIYRDLNSAIKTNVEGIGPAQSRWGDLYISSKGLKSGLAKDVVGKGTGATPGPGKTAVQAIAAKRAAVVPISDEIIMSNLKEDWGSKASPEVRDGYVRVVHYSDGELTPSSANVPGGSDKAGIFVYPHGIEGGGLQWPGRVRTEFWAPATSLEHIQSFSRNELGPGTPEATELFIPADQMYLIRKK